MQSDRYRLRQAWQKLSRAGKTDPQNAEFQKWLERVSASSGLRERRSARVPELKYDPELPITSHRQELIDLIQSRQVIVVCGETGSGKSTQLPKLCLEAGLGRSGVIGHTQPRRLAARAVASRLAEELGTRVGESVGFKIRFADSTKPETLVKLMTDGVLLAETQSDRFLDQYDAIIIDEAHERSLNIDFLLGYLRRISGQRPDLKIIITSATIDPQRVADHFADEAGPAPIVEVSGRTYPVEQRYRLTGATDGQDTAPTASDEMVSLPAITDAADELMSEGIGDILVFLPTERDIRVTAKHLRGHFTRIGGERAVEILPLYARLSHAEQNKIFESHSRRRIVLSTNVAESSLTVPGIHFVIDTGLARISRYAPRSKVQRLPIEEVSQASANQRSGRCGRLGPGVCIRLFSEDDYLRRPKFTTPEIRRSDLASVLLQSLMLRLGPLEEFPLLDPPSAESIRDAQRTLRELGAIDDRGALTPIGRQLGLLPCEPRVGRMLLEANERNCLAEVLVIAAGLECQDVRQRPAGQRPEADAAHAQFLDPHSDFLSLLRLWDFFEHLREDLGRSRLQRALTQNFLSFQGFREWADTVRQLKDILEGAGVRVGKRKYHLPPVPTGDETGQPPRGKSQGNSTGNSPGNSGKVGGKAAARVGGKGASRSFLNQPGNQQRSKQQHANQQPLGKTPHGNSQSLEDPITKLARPSGYAEIHQSLLAGLLSGIAERGDRHEYKGVGGLSVALWPGSGLFRRTPKWIMAAEILETNKRYARTAAEIDVEWIETAGAALLKHSYSDPHWSSKSGSSMVYRRSTLYGLTIASGRRVPYASIDPEAARSMLIEHGLVAGDWTCNEPFYKHNEELVADIHELAQRTRARDYIVDRFHLANFYNARLPEEITDLTSLRSWLVKQRGNAREKVLWMQPEDLLASDEHLHTIDETFPNTLKIGPTELPLEYHFEPGHEADGVTVTVPQAALRQVSEEALGWLVPGLLEEKILAIIKGLPKANRTYFVPAPDVAKKLAAALADVPRDQPFTSALSRAMSEHSGERITPNQLTVEKLPPHLRFLVQVVDNEGHVIDSSRDVVQLIAEHAPTSSATGGVVRHADEQNWSNRPVTPNDFAGIPDQVTVRRGGLLVAAFPALVDVCNAVELRLADTLDEAERISRGGLTRLFAIKHHRSLRGHVANLPGLSQASVQLSHVIGSKELAERLQDLIARIALVETQPLITDREAFEAINAQATMRISIAAQDVAVWLPKLATQAHELRLNLEQAPGLWSEVTADIRQQVGRLLGKDFLKETPWQWLAELPRYLQAARMRMEKLKNGGVAKDRKLSEPVMAAWKAYETLRSSPAVQAFNAQSAADLQQLRWYLEEFRVSVFAQQLGTKHSVSQKRINELICSLE